MNLTYIKEQSIPTDLQGWPQLSTSKSDLPELSGLVGLDLEYNPSTQRPYMVSIACQGVAVSLPIEKAIGLCHSLPNDDSVTLVGHNVLSADLEVLHNTFGTPRLPNKRPLDTLILFYLLNQHLCQGAEDKEAESLDFNRGPGKLGLSSMLSLYLPWAEYKTCRGQICEGPCPKHNESWYNALDALGPVECIPLMIEEARLFTSSDYPDGMPLMDKIYPHTLQLQHALNKMEREGTLVDREYVRQVAEEVEKERRDLFPVEYRTRYGKRGQPLKNLEEIWHYGFNPDSPAQVKKFFSYHNIKLKSSDVPSIKEAINEAKRQFKPAIAETLERLLKYKNVGRGVQNWFSDEYIHSDDRLHSRWSAYGGAMGRPVSAAPNQQNFPKRGPLYRVRGALIAPPGMKILKADCKQGEPRCMMYIGGMDPKDSPKDVYDYVVESTGDAFDKLVHDAPEYAKIIPTKGVKSAIRAASKRMVMAYLYGEGMALLSEKQLYNEKGRHYKSLINGALKVCEDWIVDDKLVCFTGEHLAHDFYRSTDYTSRKKALDFQTIVMEGVPTILRAQKKIMAEAQKGYVLGPSGRLFQLVNDDRKNIKTALAFNGQGMLSDYMQESLLIYDNLDYLPAIWIHDEFGFYVPKDWSDKKCLEFLAPMRHESTLIPGGFWCPTDAATGPNYYHLTEIQG